jgi:hypothetical protein
LANDPDERKNLAVHPDYTDVIEKLSQRLDDFFTQHANPR